MDMTATTKVLLQGVKSDGPTQTTPESLEKEFQKVYQDLLFESEDPETPSVEFQKLQELWRKSRENESRLGQRCREIQAQLAASKARSLASAARTKEDQAVMASLKKEIEKAWKMVDDAHEKDQVSRDTIQSLQREVDHLNRIVEHGSSLTLTQERLAELQRLKDDLTKDNDTLQSEITDVKETLMSREEVVAKLECEKDDLQSKLAYALEECRNENVQLQREVRLKEKIEVEFRRARAEVDANKKSLQLSEKRGDELDSRIETLEIQIKDKQIFCEHTLKELDNLKCEHQQKCHENETFQRQNKRMTDEIQCKIADMKLKEEVVKKYKNENVKLVKLRDSLSLRIKKLEEQNSLQNQHMETMKIKIHVLEKEILLAKKQVAQDEKLIDSLVRQRNALNTNLIKVTACSEKHLDLVKVSEQTKRSQELTILALKDEENKHQKIISQLEKEIAKMTKENGELRSKITQQIEEKKASDALQFVYEKNVAEGEVRFKQLQTNYDSLKSERNFYSKSLAESQDEVSELRRKLKQMTHDVDQLKEEIGFKENGFVQEKQQNEKVEKEKELLRVEIKTVRNQLADWKIRWEEQLSEKRKLIKMLSEVEQEKIKRTHQVEKLTNDKNEVNNEVIQKKEELVSLKDKIKSMDTFLVGHKVQNNVLVDDFRLLKLEVKRLRKENQRLSHSVAVVEEVQGEVMRLEKDLMKERIKCKALEEELENPHNVHRWRRLAGSDPTAYELVQKIHVLQKRLISRSEKATENNDVSLESELIKLVDEKKEAQRSNSAAIDKLSHLQQTLREKDKQIKSLCSEKEVHLMRIEDYKREMEQMKNELRGAKYKLFIMNRQESSPTCKNNENEFGPHKVAVSQCLSTPPSLNGVRIRSLGSGFRIISSASNNTINTVRPA